MSKPTIFIDGEAGTTGLQIRQRLLGRTDVQVFSIDDADRKSDARRREALNECDLAILCLPDDAARKAVSFVENINVKVLDASSAHRTTPGWVYGLPELNPTQPEEIANARFVTNPGCYPTGAVLLLAPLISSRVLPATFAAAVNAVSGYSGAGKTLITRYEDKRDPKYTDCPHAAYALQLEHKHIAEMAFYSGMQTRPIFMPAYGNYRQGILMRIPLFSHDISERVCIDEIRETLEKHYKNAKHICVLSEDACMKEETLDPTALNGSNELQIRVFSNQKHNQAVLTAVYDNLGKGASGAAVQNMNIMLGLSEAS